MLALSYLAIGLPLCMATTVTNIVSAGGYVDYFFDYVHLYVSLSLSERTLVLTGSGSGVDLYIEPQCRLRSRAGSSLDCGRTSLLVSSTSPCSPSG